MMCPACGYAMSAFDRDCPRCQGKGLMPTQSLTPPAPQPSQPVVPAAPTTPLQANNHPTPVPAPYPPAATVVSAQTYCNSCGTPNSGTAAFCSGCGQQLPALATATGGPAVGGWATPPQAYSSPQAPPPQNNINIVVTQQNNNAGWFAALLVLIFGTPLGCIAIPVALFAMTTAIQFTPIIMAILITIGIAKSTLDLDQKRFAVIAVLIFGAIVNFILYSQVNP